MITLRPSSERGAADHGWLQSQHTFSFGGYYDPSWMGFGVLRVINEDRVAGGGGFAPHGHANMEIISVVMSGALGHRDSEGNEGIINAGDVQWMSAGSGVQHSEMNGDAAETVHFLQIWIQPNESNAPPKYGQKHFPFADRFADWVVLAAPGGSDGGLPLRQDARLLGRGLRDGESASQDLDGSRKAWIQILDGEVTIAVDGATHTLSSGDGLGISDVNGVADVRNESGRGTQFLWFDLP